MFLQICFYDIVKIKLVFWREGGYDGQLSFCLYKATGVGGWGGVCLLDILFKL